MKTKYIIIIIIIILTFTSAIFVGRAWGRYEANLRAIAAYGNIPEALKDELRGMTKEDFTRIMTSMKEYSKNAVIELSLKDLFETMAVMRIESAKKETGAEGVEIYISEAKKRFLSGYHDGSSNYGEWKRLADKIAVTLSEEKTEPNKAMQQTPVSITPRADVRAAPFPSVSDL